MELTEGEDHVMMEVDETPKEKERERESPIVDAGREKKDKESWPSTIPSLGLSLLFVPLLRSFLSSVQLYPLGCCFPTS